MFAPAVCRSNRILGAAAQQPRSASAAAIYRIHLVLTSALYKTIMFARFRALSLALLSTRTHA